MMSRLPQTRLARLALAGIVLLYLALGNIYATTTPLFEKPDEHLHYAYTAYLLEKQSLPPISRDEIANPALQEAGQPPFFYTLAALAGRLAGSEIRYRPLARNPYHAYPALGIENDNKNLYLHDRDERTTGQWRSALFLRRVSLLLGAGTIVCAYGLLRTLRKSQALSLAGAGLVALLPQYLFIASSVSNDALSASLCGGAIWALVVALEQSTVLRPWLLFGLLAGLAALTKTNALVLPLLGAAFAALSGLRRRSWRTALTGAAASCGGLLLIAGWWYARNTLQYGDPLGIQIHYSTWGRPQALSAAALFKQWRGVETTFWAAFGLGNVTLPEWAYQGLRAAELLALLGALLVLLRAWRRRGLPARGWAMIVYVVAVGAALAWWTRTVAGSYGRLLFPALAPMAALAAIAWSRLWSKLPWVACGYLALLAAISPGYIGRAYQPPQMLAGATPPPNTQPADYRLGDLAEIYAFDVTPTRVMPGESVNVTLCWHVLDATPLDYSVFIQLVGQANAVINRRGTYPGLGNYPTSQWRPGDRFCDRYRVPIRPGPDGPAVYPVEVGLFELASGRRLNVIDGAGQQVPFLGIAQVKVRGATPSAIDAPLTRVTASFGDQILLQGYDVSSARCGENLELTLWWQAKARPAADYAVFVHLLDATGKIVAQGDALPQDGRYPTRWWDPPEIVSDPHRVQLPPDLAPGSYGVSIGLYRPDTGERLKLMDGGDALNLTQVTVDR